MTNEYVKFFFIKLTMTKEKQEILKKLLLDYLINQLKDQDE